MRERSIAAVKCFKENLSSNFGLIAGVVKVALEITKRAQHCVLPRFTFSLISCFNFNRKEKSWSDRRSVIEFLRYAIQVCLC